MAVDEKEDFKGRRKRSGRSTKEQQLLPVQYAPPDIELHPKVNFKPESAKHVAGEIQSSEILKQTFPANITVDELYLFRKKKHNFSWLKDNLKIEEGSFKHLKTEYQRRFKNFFDILKSSIHGTEIDNLNVELFQPKDSIKLPGEQDIKSEYNESFSRHLQRPDDTSYGLMNAVSNNEATERSHPFSYSSVEIPRPPRLLKRPTTLKIEGDFSHVTEHAEQFIEYLLAKRSELCRTPTHLKLGQGEMETKTETTEKFRKFENAERRSLIRKFTNLHLEGELDGRSEKQEQFQQYEIHKRPPLMKKSTNLRLEGDYSLVPEYRHQYVHHKNVDRPGPVLPSHNLKTANLFDNKNTNVTTQGRTSPLIPFLRESYSYHEINEDRKHKRNASSSRYQSGVSLNRTSSHPNLIKSASDKDRSVQLSSPQKNTYFGFDKRQNLEFDRMRHRRESTVSTMLTENKNVHLPKDVEYKSAFNEYSRGRSRLRRPDNNFIIEGEVSYATEKGDKFILHQNVEKRKPLRRDSKNIFDEPSDEDQHSDDRFECNPEYRKALRDYLIREKPPPGQRRRILEIPDITINSDHTENKPTSPNANKEEEVIPTSPSKFRPKSSSQKPQSLSTVPSTPTAGDSIKSSTKNQTQTSKIHTETVRLSPDKKKRVFRRSSTPSPIPPEKTKTSSREQSPSLNSNWRKSESKLSADRSIWNSTETDPAFFIVNDRVPSRGSVRQNLYKEQRWMPAWYSGEN